MQCCHFILNLEDVTLAPGGAADAAHGAVPTSGTDLRSAFSGSFGFGTKVVLELASVFPRVFSWQVVVHLAEWRQVLQCPNQARQLNVDAAGWVGKFGFPRVFFVQK